MPEQMQPMGTAPSGAAHGGTAPDAMMQEPMQQESQNGTNFISQEDQTDPREQAYETAFKDSAYNIFSAKYPTMVPSIVTFKVIKSSIVKGDAVGAFILNHLGHTMYVPIVLSDNQTKPIEIMYSKKMDKFLPFKQEWIDVITASGDQSMGESVKIPETLPADKDISRLIYPPLQGRVSYAMELSGLDHLELIKEASNETKEVYKKLLKDNPEFLKFAYENYPTVDIEAALSSHQEKVASVPVKVETVSMTTPSMKIKEVFGKDSEKAMNNIATDGFAFKDSRPELNKVFSQTDHKLCLEEPSVSGVYTIYDCDSKTIPVLIIVNPEGGVYGGLVSPVHDGGQEATGESVYGDWTNHSRNRRSKTEYLVIHGDGSYFTTENLIASPSNPNELKGKVADYIYKGKKVGNLANKNIMFAKIESQVLVATHPRFFDRVEIGKDGYKKYIKIDKYKLERALKESGNQKTSKDFTDYAVVNSCTPTGKILRPANSDVTFIPTTYRPIPLGEKINGRTHLTTAEEVLTHVHRKMNGTGGRTVKLANIGSGEFSIDGISHGQLKTASLELANTFLVSMDTAVSCFKKLAHFGNNESILVMPHEKKASIFSTGGNGAQMSPEGIQQQMAPPQMGPPNPLGSPEEMEMMEQPNTDMMGVGQQTNDPDIYNLGVMNSLSQQQDIRELLAVYSPTLEKALDNAGRMLLTFWIKGSEAKMNLGEETYHTTEESLRTVFRELGGLLTKLNKRSAAVQEDMSRGY